MPRSPHDEELQEIGSLDGGPRKRRRAGPSDDVDDEEDQSQLHRESPLSACSDSSTNRHPHRIVNRAQLHNVVEQPVLQLSQFADDVYAPLDFGTHPRPSLGAFDGPPRERIQGASEWQQSGVSPSDEEASQLVAASLYSNSIFQGMIDLAMLSDLAGIPSGPAEAYQTRPVGWIETDDGEESTNEQLISFMKNPILRPPPSDPFDQHLFGHCRLPSWHTGYLLLTYRRHTESLAPTVPYEAG